MSPQVPVQSSSSSPLPSVETKAKKQVPLSSPSKSFLLSCLSGGHRPLSAGLRSRRRRRRRRRRIFQRRPAPRGGRWRTIHLSPFPSFSLSSFLRLFLPSLCFAQRGWLTASPPLAVKRRTPAPLAAPAVLFVWCCGPLTALPCLLSEFALGSFILCDSILHSAHSPRHQLSTPYPLFFFHSAGAPHAKPISVAPLPAHSPSSPPAPFLSSLRRHLLPLLRACCCAALVLCAPPWARALPAAGLCAAERRGGRLSAKAPAHDADSESESETKPNTDFARGKQFTFDDQNNTGWLMRVARLHSAAAELLLLFTRAAPRRPHQQ